MPEKLLNLTKVRSPIEHMRGRAMPQGMRTDIRNTGIPRMLVHDSSDHPLVDASAAVA